MPKKEIRIVNRGLYSSHSPGRSRFAGGTATGSYFTPIDSMSRAYSGAGWEYKEINIETTIITAAINMPCHKPSVCDNGMTPLISRIDLGKDAGAAMMRAAEDDKPSAQTLPIPRYPAAPSAR